MALTYNDKLWKDYIKHVLLWEGGKSSDLSDSAVKCVTPGMIHTNKGVTFCTYKSMAAKFGLDPSHAAFLNLTDDNAAKFLFDFYKLVRGNELPDIVAIYHTENGWGSGTGYYPWKHLFDSYKNLGIKPKFDKPLIKKQGNKTYYSYSKQSKDEAIQIANQLNEKTLIDELIKVRTNFLKSIAQGKNKKYLGGWLNRTNAFTTKFAGLAKNVVTNIVTQKKKYVIIFGIGLFLLYVYIKKKK
jgi:hypothetical protein